LNTLLTAGVLFTLYYRNGKRNSRTPHRNADGHQVTPFLRARAGCLGCMSDG